MIANDKNIYPKSLGLSLDKWEHFTFKSDLM